MKSTALFPVFFLYAFPLLVQAQSDPAMTAEPVTAPPVQVEAFEDRLLLAKDAEEDEQYNNYHSAVLKRNSRHFARTMRSCIRNSPKPADKSFILVADITPQGKADAVVVKPDNKVANCFASGFASVSYPKPPQYPNREGFPVMMKVRVAR